MSNFVDGEAFQGSDDEREEQADEYDTNANGDVKEGPGTVPVRPYDSSEEDEEEDDDEEAARAVRLHPSCIPLL